MITDIPSAADYDKTALSLLNLAWGITLELAVALDEAKQYDAESIEEKQYWCACHTQLTTAISLIQQALEFELKSRIAAVSPYLLIAGPPEKWPKGCNTNDLPFADFYALEAQELLRAHDTVARQRLPEAIKLLFTDLRKRRNSIMHTVDKRLRIEVKEVIIAVLEIADWSIGQGMWLTTRRSHMDNSPDSIAYSSFCDSVTYLLAREVLKVVEMLSPADTKRLLGFDKKQRRYVCFQCLSDCADTDLQPNLALLNPNTPDSTTLHCFLCNQDHPVLREGCPEPECKGNVLDTTERCCLSCLSSPDDQTHPSIDTKKADAMN